MMKNKILIIWLVLGIFVSLSACQKTAQVQSGLKVVASTTIVGDVVRQIGGDQIDLTVLYPVGTDPHTFEPRPQDAAAVADARIIFLNGLELEHSLDSLITTNATGTVVYVSDGVEVLPFTPLNAGDSTEGETFASGDPHTWMDPNLVMTWVENIQAALSNADPVNAAYYATNAANYRAQLADLDAWIQNEVAIIPQDERKLVTDHENMGYFIHRYGFTLTGLVVDSLSTGASPSAQELSRLEDLIRQQNVKAIFVGSTVNPALSEQIASDTGVNIVTINTESLGSADSDTSSYIFFMKKLVTSIVAGLQ